jgi:hypothetical protein
MSPQMMPQPQRKRFWTAGKAIAFLVVIIIVGIAIVGVATQMPYLKEGSSALVGFSQVLYKNGDNNSVHPTYNQVTFPYSIMACQGNKTRPVDIFDSIIDDVMEVRDGQDHVWDPQAHSNTLTVIAPYVTYYVKVSKQCTLELESCLGGLT